ncbi:uncharacterized protein LOC117108424 [Anneissia japonica]|uniref:uncharacterized protein LOC117108424 n=1 Tax=Anneissia japonica TaxID=1529436 RepID=UPI0014256EF4|nr:uncharacterized protein LOC117108424 [Anneissia japonica]
MTDFVVYIFPLIGLIILIISCCCSHKSKECPDDDTESDNQISYDTVAGLSNNGHTTVNIHLSQRVESPDPSTFTVPPSYEDAVSMGTENEEDVVCRPNRNGELSQPEPLTPQSPPPSYDTILFDRLLSGLPILSPEFFGDVTFKFS